MPGFCHQKISQIWFVPHTDTGKVMKVVFTADNTPVITEEISVSDFPKITRVIVCGECLLRSCFHRHDLLNCVLHAFFHTSRFDVALIKWTTSG